MNVRSINKIVSIIVFYGSTFLALDIAAVVIMNIKSH